MTALPLETPIEESSSSASGDPGPAVEAHRSGSPMRKSPSLGSPGPEHFVNNKGGKRVPYTPGSRSDETSKDSLFALRTRFYRELGSPPARSSLTSSPAFDDPRTLEPLDPLEPSRISSPGLTSSGHTTEGSSSFRANLLHPPVHVLPASFFIHVPFSGSAQGSMGFIFTVVTTMMGSTLFSMPYGFQQAGVLMGTLVTVGFALASFYTSTLILEWGLMDPEKVFEDFGDLCQEYVGPKTKLVANMSAILVVLGAVTSYHVVMATFLQSTMVSAKYVFGGVPDKPSTLKTYPISFLCCGMGDHQYTTTAIAICVGVLPLLFIRDITKLAVLGSYGVLALIYNVVFLVVNGASNIVQVVQLNEPLETPTSFYVGSVQQVGHLVGMMGLSLFIHSVLLPIAGGHHKVRTEPKVVIRDLGIAMFLAALLYIVVGLVPAVAFELGKGKLKAYDGIKEFDQNVLLDFEPSHFAAALGRGIAVLQIGIVFPILIGVIRKQFYHGIFNIEHPSWAQITIFNVSVATLTTTVVCTYPHVAAVNGIVGTFTAIVYMLWLPLVVNINASKDKGRVSCGKMFANISLGVVGTLVILSQYL
eukprot:TRINITY_DN25329_c0_g1_i4.p1 TRINITY_DN25329_c0_g1~~TRINITY_DN25329_c0_g1_i4.p1  ORF type:complete len:639 (-),score=87.66 TRINITY_DN25329_c0_g1_i4:30-1796(-)